MLRAELQSARMSKITNDSLTQSVIGCWYRMHYSCTDVATMAIKGLNPSS